MKRIALLILVLFAVSAVADDAKPSTPPTSPAAVTAIKKADGAVAKAKADYEKAVADARKTELTDLKQAEIAAMKNTDLDEANRINATIAAVQAETPMPEKPKKTDPRAELMAKLAGTKWDGSVLKADGSIVRRKPGAGGSWYAITSDSIVIVNEDNWIDLWQFNADLSEYHGSHGRLESPWTTKRDQ